jgi:hypothetical protein
MPDLKLLTPGTPEEQPSYPRTNIQVVPQGAIITVMFAPDLHLTKLLDEQTMNDICKLWMQSRKQLKNDMELAARVMRGSLP